MNFWGADQRAGFFFGGVEICKFAEDPGLNLEKLREPGQDNMQAITAVQESERAILAALLLKVVPECIFSTSLGSAAGFGMTKVHYRYYSRKNIPLCLAVYQGGLVAEELVFGKESVIRASDYRSNDYLHEADDVHNRRII